MKSQVLTQAPGDAVTAGRPLAGAAAGAALRLHRMIRRKCGS
jgi:hypothetical protein